MKIEKNKYVSLVYELRENNSHGKVIEVLEETSPMTFVYGSGRLLPHFEESLLSLEKGDRFDFALDSSLAYGERSEDMIINIPSSVFESDGKIDENICQIGNEVPMMDKEGNRINGIIYEITDTYVRMDFNHPMAGTNLHFTGKIIDVRDATAEEIAGTNNSCSSCGNHDHEAGCDGSCS
jgi:FKBP-type peptidyl-prolyl cis-trans isomerase SlyD